MALRSRCCWTLLFSSLRSLQTMVRNTLHLCMCVCVFRASTAYNTFLLRLFTVSAAKDVQGIWMMKRAQNTVSLHPTTLSLHPPHSHVHFVSVAPSPTLLGSLRHSNFVFVSPSLSPLTSSSLTLNVFPPSLCFQTVDAKKLEKAEAKLKAKHERRNEKDTQKATTPLSVHTWTSPAHICPGVFLPILTCPSLLSVNRVLEEASASQASSKKDNRVDQSGKNRSYDIRIENFDVSFGER